ncbi:MAG: hypothetical protein EOO04_08930 [Chitinophagaceae bacterium]|nr:MAG: hypothetical protein EOO04_08930 [Chitinophagaceae bacterium]
MASAQSTSKQQTGTLNVVGVDQFGRTVPAIGGYKAKKQVGIFYWPWVGQPYASGIYDATKISAMPNGLKLLYDFKSLDTAISPTGQAHFWGEPLFGYYNSADEWVIRRQLKMLTTAGVDFIVFDLTNRVTYRNVYEKVLRIIEEFQQQGWNAPRAVFYTHSKSIETTMDLYKNLYRPNLYSNAWYKVNGKPMIIAYTDTADDRAEAITRSDHAYQPVPYPQDVLDFFYFKKPQWPFDPTFEEGFPWIEWKFPQPLHGGIMSVSVASHPKVPMSRSVTSGWINWGRGWNPDTQQNVAEDVDKGTFFQRQWDHAIKVDPDTVFIGGWNEWVAYKQPYGDEYMLCDAANKEYSRDIEPMKGGFEDAFYIQMMQNIRRYKGLPAAADRSEARQINLKGNLSQWNNVNSYYNVGNTAFARSSYGASKIVFYESAAPVNNLQEMKVAHDKDFIYFYIRFEKDFKPADTSLKGLNIFIGVGEPARIGWQGYQFMAHQLPGAKGFTLSKLSESFAPASIGKPEFSINKNIVQLRVSRKQLQAAPGVNSIYFKATDGTGNPADIMDTYLSGSAMPMGRLSYEYRFDDKK